MPRATKIKHETVDRLPPTAMTVSTFADANSWDKSYVYKLLARGKLSSYGKKIVTYQGINFVVPLNVKTVS